MSYDTYMNPLVEGVVQDAGEKEDQEFGSLPFLLVKCKDGKLRVVWILRDPEGNGPGHPDIEEVEFR